MIALHTWLTPNGRKVSIMLEETGLPYQAIPVNIGQGDQHLPAFRALNPNGRIPVLVDPDGPGGRRLVLWESGAILQYLAEKTGQFLPSVADARWNALQWLHFQMSALGPMLGQTQHFRLYASEKVPYAIDRFGREAARLFGVVEGRLSEAPWLAGEDYTIADIAAFPWMRAWKVQGIDISHYPAVSRWLDLIEARPAVQRERQVLAEHRKARPPSLDTTTRTALFGRPGSNNPGESE